MPWIMRKISRSDKSRFPQSVDRSGGDTAGSDIPGSMGVRLMMDMANISPKLIPFSQPRVLDLLKSGLLFQVFRRLCFGGHASGKSLMPARMAFRLPAGHR